MSRLFEALRVAADGAFVIDEELRIVYWNKAAEAILGFTSEDVAGQFCYKLLHGYDEGRHLVCRARCQVAKSALMSKPVPNYDIHVKTKQEYKRWLNVSVFTYRMGDTNGKKTIVHLFHHLSHKEVDAKVLTQMVKLISRYQHIPPKNGTEMELRLEALTPRELEILELLARGHGTSEISELLAISQNTVRNHIQHILQKLQVHTRLEAVTYAIKNGLIRY
ncbi:MAG: LuxR C-terminal-related transcriptional regulator [Anaerolineales bacterium]